jgi:hypothetical protein
MCANGVRVVTSLLGIIETQTYLAEAERLMSEEERAAVVDMIAGHPETGKLIRGTRGLRKLRIPLRGRGKRGGGRVVYWFHSEGHPAVLLTVYAKNERADLGVRELRRFETVAAAIIEHLGARK